MDFNAFATVDDLLDGWPNKTFSEQERIAAGVLLFRASGYLAGLLAKKHIEIDPSDMLQAVNLKTVTVNMVRRSMSSGAIAFGASSNTSPKKSSPCSARPKRSNSLDGLYCV